MKKQDFRKFAPIGLYLAGLAALAAAGLYIVQRSFTLPLQISLGLIIIGLALFVMLDPQRTVRALTGRQARYGSNTLLMSLAFIGILVVVNYLANNYSKRWDLTEDQRNTLAPESKEVLDSIQGSVVAEAYYSAGTYSENARELLELFKSNSNGRFDYEFIDPNTNPIKAQEANVTSDRTIVLKMDGRQEQVTYASEEEITSALLKLANPGDRVVYFLTGHGEYPIDTSVENNYSQVSQGLAAKNYTVNQLNLLANPNIPEDALALIIAGPAKPLSQQEIDAIKGYLGQGGSLVYLAEPTPLTEFTPEEDLLGSYLADDWGITLEDNLIIDLSSNQPLIAVSNRFGTSPITTKMNTLAVLMPSARGILLPDEDPEGLVLTELAITAENSWGETDFESVNNQQVQADEGEDKVGPLTLAASAENTETGARVVVIGDSDFAAFGAFRQYGNGEFLLNSIDWAAHQDSLISLTPRQQTQRFLVLPQRTNMGLIFLGSVIMMPLLVAIVGISVWVQRRRSG